MNAEKTLLAGEVAAQLGIGVQTLHYYEREKLIPKPSRNSAGYRLYSEQLVERVRFIRKAQALGLSLEETREILQLVDDGSAPCTHVQAALTEKLQEVDRRLAELRAFRKELSSLIDQIAVRTPDLAPEEGCVCGIIEAAQPSMSRRELSASRFNVER